jgi:hypothetical protein
LIIREFYPKLTLTRLKAGLLTLEYRFAEDYGNGLLVPSVPAYFRLIINRTGCGGFPWSGDDQ